MKKLLTCIVFLCSILCANAQVIHSAYDVNGDGKIDITDITMLTQRLVGKIKDDAIHTSTIKIDTIHYQSIVNDTIHKQFAIVDTIRTYYKDDIYQYSEIIPEKKKTYTINGIEYPMPEAIDFGLPSGIKWANMDIGSTSYKKNGIAFYWNDTTTICTPEEYVNKICTPYYKDYDDYGYPTYTYLKYNFDKLIDPATYYLGSEWRLPTREELDELLKYTEKYDIDYDYCIYTRNMDFKTMLVLLTNSQYWTSGYKFNHKSMYIDDEITPCTLYGIGYDNYPDIREKHYVRAVKK